MKKRTKRIIIIIVLVFILFGFIFGLFFDGIGACTAMYCNCPSEGSAEVPCNRCSTWDPLFATFIIDYGKSCSARQIIICEEGERTIRYDLDETTCKYRFEFFSLKYILGSLW